MPVSAQSPAPYATGSAVVGIIRRFRDKGLTAPFTGEVLIRAGVSETLANRTLQALITLELIDDKGMPTPTLEKMRVVSEKDYKACVADWVKSAYAEVFKFVDPAKDDATSVRDAFRSYAPVGQQERMVALFMALCAEAGLVEESKKSQPKPQTRKLTLVQRASSTPATPRNIARHSEFSTTGSLPPALAGLMQSLPSNGTGWTKDQRDRFVATFQSVLDFVVPVVEHPPAVNENDEENSP